MTQSTIPEPLRRDLLALREATPSMPPTLSLAQAHALCEQHGVSRGDLARAALGLGIVPRRYLRNIGTIRLQGQLALLEASVAIIGCGGLGGWVAEALTRMGVGHLRLVDGDSFQEDNLNRQLACTEETIGQPKADALARRLKAVNSDVAVEARVAWLESSNARALLSDADVAVDALDTLPARYLLRDAAAAEGIPLVHGAIAGWTGQVMVAPPDEDGLRAWYGPTPPVERGIESEWGNPAPTPLIVAGWQAAQAIMLLTGIGEPLCMRLLYNDMERGDVRQFELS